MKLKIYLLLLTSFLSVSSFAQRVRGHIENVTNYESLSQTSSSKARKVGTRESAPLPCMGSPKVPVILVQFSDLKFSVAETRELVQKKYDDYFNLQTGNANNSLGSVYQYFQSQSNGQFTPEFDVIGPVTLDKGYAYYGENGSKKDVRIGEFFSDACKIVLNDFKVDWNAFDNNKDGMVDFVFFIYAGEGENASDDTSLIWPKECVSSETIGGVTFGAYGLTNELYMGKMDGIGTAIHEISHGLGLPDIYDTVGSCDGMDAWSIMDGGNYQMGGLAPISYNAYERDFMGWNKIVALDIDKSYTLAINPLEKNGSAYKLANPANDKEYFILENRQDDGQYGKFLGWPSKKIFDKYGSIHGLLINHVDYDKSAWTRNRVNVDKNHQRFAIVPADGEFVSSVSQNYVYNEKWCESLRGDLYPGAQGVTSMSSYSVFTGGTLPATVDNIREIGDVIYLDINGGSVADIKEIVNTFVPKAEALTAKMGKAEATALANAIAAAKSASTKDALDKALVDITDAIAAAELSIELYNKVNAIIKNAELLGEAGKKSFANAGVQAAYDNGTIESLAKVQTAYDNAVKAQTEADGAAKTNLNNLIKSAKDIKNSKMGKAEADALAAALNTAESANGTDAVASATVTINSAITTANTSIELYKKVDEVIKKAAALGEAGKASFDASGVKAAYDNGTIESIEKVQDAYNKAVKVQADADKLASAKKELNDLVASCETLKNSKMGKAEADALAAALTAAASANDTTAIASAKAAINNAVTAANTSVDLYKKVDEIIQKAMNLGEEGKASFTAAGIRAAYENGTIVSLEDVQKAYDNAVKEQETANGIDEVSASSKTKVVFGLDGKARTDVKKGVNIINGKKVMKK